MQLTARVHLVGSGASGLDLTDRYDAHAYLIDGDAEAALVDVGCGRGVDAILERVRAAGVAPQRLRHLLLTHGHPDHCGGAAGASDRLAHLTVAASPEVAAWVSAADEAALSVEQGKRAEFYPADFSFAACPVPRALGDRDRLGVGDLQVEVLATPGHADGHLAFLLREPGGATVLFGGDLVFYGGKVSLLNTWDCRIQAYAASLDRLRTAGVDVLLPGHHGFSLRDGQRHIDRANRLFDAGFVPPSLV